MSVYRDEVDRRFDIPTKYEGGNIVCDKCKQVVSERLRHSHNCKPATDQPPHVCEFTDWCQDSRGIEWKACRCGNRKQLQLPRGGWRSNS